MYSRKNEKKSLFRNYKNALAGLVALATALAIGLTLSGCAAEQPAAPQTTEAPAPQTTKAPAPQTTEAPAPQATEAPAPQETETEAPTEARAPITAVEVVDPTSAYICYWEELQANRDRIAAYTRSDQTALFDVYGNEIPELFYFAQNPEEPYYYDLYVCTYSAGKVYAIQTFPKAYGEVQISDSLAIFGSSGEAAMAVYYVDCSETELTRSVTLFRDWDDPQPAAEKRESDMDETEEYTVQGAPSDEAGFEKACYDALSGFDCPILTTTGGWYDPAAVMKTLDEKPPVSLSLEDMIAFLENKMSGN